MVRHWQTRLGSKGRGMLSGLVAFALLRQKELGGLQKHTMSPIPITTSTDPLSHCLGTCSLSCRARRTRLGAHWLKKKPLHLLRSPIDSGDRVPSCSNCVSQQHAPGRTPLSSLPSALSAGPFFSLSGAPNLYHRKISLSNLRL